MNRLNIDLWTCPWSDLCPFYRYFITPLKALHGRFWLSSHSPLYAPDLPVNQAEAEPAPPPSTAEEKSTRDTEDRNHEHKTLHSLPWYITFVTLFCNTILSFLSESLVSSFAPVHWQSEISADYHTHTQTACIANNSSSYCVSVIRYNTKSSNSDDRY